MTRAITAVLVVGLLLLASIGVAGADGGDETVVVAVGDSDVVLHTTQAIAADHGYTMLQTDAEGLSASDQQVLSQRIEHGQLDRVILVGNDTSGVEPEVRSVSADIRIELVEAGTETQVPYAAALQAWDSSETAVVVDDSEQIDAVLPHLSGPVLHDDTDDKQAILDHLGVTDVYALPNANVTALEDGYTVHTSYNGTSFDQPVDEVAAAFFDGGETVTVATPDTTGMAWQVGDDFLVTGDDGLGAAAADLGTENEVYLVGDVDRQAVWNATDSPTTKLSPIQASVYASPYEYGLAVSEVAAEDGDVGVTITNVGQGTIPVVDGESVVASWTGLIESSTPSGEQVGEEYRVSHDKSLAPGESFDVSLDAQEVENGGHPTLDYYVESDTGLIGTGSDSPVLPGLDWTPSLVVIVLIATAAGVLTYVGALQARNRFKS